MNNLIKSVTFVFTLAISSIAYGGCTQTGNSINLLTAQSTNANIFTEVLDHNNECGCDSYLFRTESSSNVLSLLLSAKTSASKVTIDIDDPNDCKTAFRVGLEGMDLE